MHYASSMSLRKCISPSFSGMPIMTLMDYCLRDNRAQSETHIIKYFPIYPMLKRTNTKYKVQILNSKIFDNAKLSL